MHETLERNGTSDYRKLLREILDHGDPFNDRTGVGTLGLFAKTCKYNLYGRLPLITTKRVWYTGVLRELLWMLSGSTNVRDLQEHKVRIWDEWADDAGELGPVYGAQWRAWTGLDGRHRKVQVDQIRNVIESIRTNPSSRRHIVTAWNPTQIGDMALPPCHLLFQFHVRPTDLRSLLVQYSRYAFDRGQSGFGSATDCATATPETIRLYRDAASALYRISTPGLSLSDDEAYTIESRVKTHMQAMGWPIKPMLDCMLYQRSADMFLGVPFNIASYATLTYMIAHLTGCSAGVFTHTLGNAHIYNNHIVQCNEQLTRESKDLPFLKIVRDVKDIDDFKFEDIVVLGYESHPTIKASVAR